MCLVDLHKWLGYGRTPWEQDATYVGGRWGKDTTFTGGLV